MRRMTAGFSLQATALLAKRARGCRAWQFSPELRIARLVCFAAVLALPALYLWLTLGTNGFAQAGWIALAGWGLALAGNERAAEREELEAARDVTKRLAFGSWR
jgi:hypothetical protein